MVKNKVLDKIKSILGHSKVLDSVEDRLCYSYDATGKNHLPDLVVKARDTQDVVCAVKSASDAKIPIVPRGSGSGFVGGSIPVKGGIVLALSSMDTIIEIDERNLMAVVEPGVITYALQNEVERLGMFYPPDPSSLKISTIGGNVATCAGGPRAVKYGVTRDYVLGLEVILPSGELLQTGGKVTKSVAGYDLTRLFVGSEGTLGIITKIILRLIPKPETVQTMLALFPGIDNASRAVSDIISSKIVPSTLEFMDRSAVLCVEDYADIGLPKNIQALLLIEIDGDESSTKRQAEQVQKLLKKNGANDVRIANSDIDRAHIWKIRRSISPALGAIRPTKINQDIAVPRSLIPEMVKRLNAIADKYQLLIVNFGHAGDGNIHVNIMTDSSNKEEMKRANAAVAEIFESTLAFGGTISGEHGIGISKSTYLEKEIGTTGIMLTKKIKAAVDPLNIMNPGKIIVV